MLCLVSSCGEGEEGDEERGKKVVVAAIPAGYSQNYQSPR